jgi:hypothetical protein
VVERFVVEVEEEVGGGSGILWRLGGMVTLEVSSYELLPDRPRMESECSHGVRVSWLK